MHALCRFFIDNLGPGVSHGRQELMPYTVDMPRLFEAFVAEWLRLYGPHTFVYSKQHKLKLSGSQSIEWAVDILVSDRQSGNPIAVIDTKYKRQSIPSPADIQQVVAYAVEARTNLAFLIYPTSDIVPLKVNVGDVEVRAAHFDVEKDLTGAGSRLLVELGLTRD